MRLHWLPSWQQYLAVFIGTLSVTSAGVAFAWMEPLMLRMSEEFNLSPGQSSWLMSSIEYGELILSIPVGVLADRFGRKWVLLSSGPFGLLAWAMILWDQTIHVLYVARFIQGIVLAIVFSVLPLYIAEVSEPKVRGLLAGQFQVMWSVGLLFTYITGPYLTFNAYAVVCGIMPFAFTILFAMMPESPYYYFMIRKNQNARESLEWLRGYADVQEELQSIQKSVERDMVNKASWKDVFATRKDRRIFFTVQSLCFIKYMIGTTAMSTNAADTFARASTGALDEHTATIIFGSLLVSSAFFGSLLSDKFGRRPLLIGTLVLIGIANIMSGIYFYLQECTDIDMGRLSWIVYATIGPSAILSNIGPSSLLQTVQGELFPSHTRAMGSALTGITASVATFLNLKQYQTVIDYFGHYLNFFIFSVFAISGAILIYFILKETAGKSLGEIQSERRKNPCFIEPKEQNS